jgi:signal transduction histidine kinase
MEAMQELPPDLRRMAVRAEAEDATVRIDVRDTGTGIESDHLPRLFDPFFTTKATGLGIGLRICASIVDAHGGRIWAANNTDGPGATFHFTLPTAAS